MDAAPDEVEDREEEVNRRQRIERLVVFTAQEKGWSAAYAKAFYAKLRPRGKAKLSLAIKDALLAPAERRTSKIAAALKLFEGLREAVERDEKQKKQGASSTSSNAAAANPEGTETASPPPPAPASSSTGGTETSAVKPEEAIFLVKIIRDAEGDTLRCWADRLYVPPGFHSVLRRFRDEFGSNVERVQEIEYELALILFFVAQALPPVSCFRDSAAFIESVVVEGMISHKDCSCFLQGAAPRISMSFKSALASFIAIGATRRDFTVLFEKMWPLVVCSVHRFKTMPELEEGTENLPPINLPLRDDETFAALFSTQLQPRVAATALDAMAVDEPAPGAAAALPPSAVACFFAPALLDGAAEGLPHLCCGSTSACAATIDNAIFVWRIARRVVVASASAVT